MRRGLKSFWRRLLAKAPRRLTITRSGKCLIAIAMATGLAALNTGNNPLFLAWGMVLGAMLVSGVLSEAALRPLTASLRVPHEVRAETPCHLRVRLCNSSQILPAMAIEVLIEVVRGADEPRTLYAPIELRLDAQKTRELFVGFTPQGRGHHWVTGLSVRTSYPFGLFVKERPLPHKALHFVAQPAGIRPQPRYHSIFGDWGDRAAARAGGGEDYFATRGYMMGDPLKHVLWRRAAKTGQWLVVEREAMRTRRITAVLAFAPQPQPKAVEAAISAAAAFLEQMLEEGLSVGLVAPGIHIEPGADAPGRQAQRRKLLQALGGLDVSMVAPKPKAPRRGHGSVVYFIHDTLMAAPPDAKTVLLNTSIGTTP